MIELDMRCCPSLCCLLLLALPARAGELGDLLVIETSRGDLSQRREVPGVKIRMDTAMPLGETPVSVRILAVAQEEVEAVDLLVDGKASGRLRRPPFRFLPDFGKRPAAHKLVASVTLKSGERLTGSLVTQTPSSVVMNTAVDLVEVGVIVKDGEGRVVRDLTQSDFTVKDNGVERPIVEFVKERAPLSLVLVLDSSGSMEGRLWSLRKAAIDFVKKVDQDVPIQVIDFDHEVRLAQEFTLERKQVIAAINRLKVGGGTHLWDAAASGAFALSGRATRRAVVLFTDGKDQSSDDDETRIVSGLDEVIERAREDRVQCYCIGFGRRVDHETLARLSEETGGVFYRASSTKEFRAVYDSILADIDAQYLISYEPPEDSRHGGFHTIEVALTRPGLKAIHRKGYSRRR